MKLHDWRAQRRIEVTLPSGLTVTLQRIDLPTLVFTGQIPKPVLSEIAEFSADGTGYLDLSDIQSIVLHLDKLPALVQMFNTVVKCALVDPPCADIADDTHVAVDELSFADRQFIYDVVTKEVRELMPFLEQSRGGIDSGCTGTAVSSTPIRDTESG